MAGHIGDEVLAHNARGQGARCFGGVHIIALLQGQHQTAHFAREPGPVDEGEHHNDAGVNLFRRPLRRDCGRQSHPERQLWEGPNRLDQALYNIIKDAVIITGVA